MTAKEETQKRQEQSLKMRGELAYERLSSTRRIEDIDKQLAMFDVAIQVNSLVLKDLDTEAAIVKAKAAQTTTEVKPNE